MEVLTSNLTVHEKSRKTWTNPGVGSLLRLIQEELKLYLLSNDLQQELNERFTYCCN